MVNTTKEIIDSLAKGKMVIIMDDENRENEGDLVMASEFVKAKDINFMASKKFNYKINKDILKSFPLKPT